MENTQDIIIAKASLNGLEKEKVLPYNNFGFYGLSILFPLVAEISFSAPAGDSDGDGVKDSIDECSNTESGVTVDAFGCSAVQNIAKILELYARLDLKGWEPGAGLPTNGPVTNMVSYLCEKLHCKETTKTITVFDGQAITIKGNRDGGFECGEYQGTLIAWLEAMRKSATGLGGGSARAYKNLFTNVDYGPVQTYSYAHQAIVIYPKGTNWKWTGTILDPWFVQNTRSYPVHGWGAHFPGVKSDLLTWLLADESRYYTSGFPMYGTGYSDEIESAIIAARAVRVAQIKAQRFGVQADCPIYFHFMDQGGNRIGYYEGEGFVNEIPGAFVTMGYLSGGDDMVWYFALPEGTYAMEGTGKSADDFVLRTSYANQGIFDYGVNPITKGGTATLVIRSEDSGALLYLPGESQPVTPTLIQRPKRSLPGLPLLLQ